MHETTTLLEGAFPIHILGGAFVSLLLSLLSEYSRTLGILASDWMSIKVNDGSIPNFQGELIAELKNLSRCTSDLHHLFLTLAEEGV
jgi:hypothetical protein